jgi:peptidoglycan/LPS O-acetylase OafA/YrhL
MKLPRLTDRSARTPAGNRHTAVQGISGSTGGRFLMIDGLRGVAAMMVVVYHLHIALYDSVRAWIPSAFDSLLAQGNLGVDIFFVLSGFAISHSVRNGNYTLGYLGRFALRRSIRLDPPLWAAIAAELVLIKVALRVYPDLGTQIPSAGQVVANVTYLQHFVGSRDIVPVFWSLTYEAQFYLVTVLSLVIWQHVPETGGLRRWKALGTYAIASLAFTYSALIFLNFLASPKDFLFIDRWFQFALGALAWAAVTRRVPLSAFIAAWLLVAAVAAVSNAEPYRILATSAALLTSALLVWAGVSGRLSTVLAGRVAQFLGKISYSLYLLHAVVGWRFIALCKRLIGVQLSPIQATIVGLAGVALSIASAWVMYVTVEAPSLRLAKRVHL